MRYHILTGLIGLSVAFGSAIMAEPPVAVTCVEDTDCWDWKTMGNGCRGIDGMIECYRDGGYYIMEAR